MAILRLASALAGGSHPHLERQIAKADEFRPDRLGLAWLFGPNPKIGAISTFRPYYVLGLDPAVWGLASSFCAGIVVSLGTPPPDPKRVARLFESESPEDRTFATL